MLKFKTTKYLSNCLLLLFLLFSAPLLLAQNIVESGVQSAGFRFATDDTVSSPIIHYQQKMQMLSAIDDRLSLRIFGNGHVLVHFPVYMKKAGDYEFWLSQPELVQLIQALSSHGIMDFDHAHVKDEKRKHDLKMKAKGQLYHVSDALETIVDVRLQDYQRTASSPVQANLEKRFAWKNLQQDAKLYKNNQSIQSAAKVIKSLDNLFLHKEMKKIK